MFHITHFTQGDNQVLISNLKPRRLTDLTTASKRSLRRSCFHRCLSVHGGCLCPGGSVSGGSVSRGVCVQGDSYLAVFEFEFPTCV